MSTLEIRSTGWLVVAPVFGANALLTEGGLGQLLLLLAMLAAITAAHRPDARRWSASLRKHRR